VRGNAGLRLSVKQIKIALYMPGHSETRYRLVGRTLPAADILCKDRMGVRDIRVCVCVRSFILAPPQWLTCDWKNRSAAKMLEFISRNRKLINQDGRSCKRVDICCSNTNFRMTFKSDFLNILKSKPFPVYAYISRLRFTEFSLHDSA